MIVDDVRNKLEEYGLKIFNENILEEAEHVFYTEHMILFIEIDNDVIGVSFQATTKPETVANMCLILHETPYKLDIMESFIYDENNQCLTGEQAFNLITKVQQSKTIAQFMKEQTYTQILIASKNTYEC